MNWENRRSPDNKFKTALMISVFITIVSVYSIRSGNADGRISFDLHPDGLN